MISVNPNKKKDHVLYCTSSYYDVKNIYLCVLQTCIVKCKQVKNKTRS